MWLINGHTTQITNLNLTNTSILTSLSNKQDIYTQEKQYPTRLYDNASLTSTVQYLETTAILQTITLNNDGITNDYGTYTT